MSRWDFCGCTEPLEGLRRIVESGRLFFCRIKGRRRIGKTTLLGELAKTEVDLSNRQVYMQVPDSEERDMTYRQACLS